MVLEETTANRQRTPSYSSHFISTSDSSSRADLNHTSERCAQPRQPTSRTSITQSSPASKTLPENTIARPTTQSKAPAHRVLVTNSSCVSKIFTRDDISRPVPQVLTTDASPASQTLPQDGITGPASETLTTKDSSGLMSLPKHSISQPPNPSKTNVSVTKNSSASKTFTRDGISRPAIQPRASTSRTSITKRRSASKTSTRRRISRPVPRALITNTSPASKKFSRDSVSRPATWPRTTASGASVTQGSPASKTLSKNSRARPASKALTTNRSSSPKPLPKNSTSRPTTQSTTPTSRPRYKKDPGLYTIRPSSCILPVEIPVDSVPGSSRSLNTLSPLHDTDQTIPETLPDRTQVLWGRVMSGIGARADTAASRAKKDARGGGNAGRGNERALGAASTSTSTKLSIAAKPADPDLSTVILNRRGIFIDFMSSSIDTFIHFGTSAPSTDRILHYQQSNNATKVWLNVKDEDVQDIQREYLYMNVYRLCEAEFSTYAKDTFLKADIRSIDPFPGRPWIVTRMVELVAKPDEAFNWTMPPVIDSKLPMNKRYDFDIRPDCSYWLSAQGFNPEYKNQIRDWTFCKDDRMTCPYMTIEFKRDDVAYQAAINQLATFSALALYNRYVLKEKRLRTTGKPWNVKNFGQLRHYGLTFTGWNYAFWCTTPIKSTDFRWKGCNMKRIYQSNCSNSAGITTLVDWINEIHLWGLTVHAKSCESDVKHCIQQHSSGIRTSLGQDDDSDDADDEDELNKESSE